MRSLTVVLSVFFLSQVPAIAQNESPPSAGTFENVTIGEPMVNLHPVLGDPVRVFTSGGAVIWRYLTHGNGVYLYVLVKDNVAQSVTVMGRFAGVHYTDAKGMTFGMTPDQVKTALGAPRRESTNADDGSLDLWYLAQPYGWVYEFHANRLDFIQLIASPDLLRSFAPGPAAAPNDGTSLASAIWIRPPNLIANTAWIGAFLATTPCGNGGTWKQTSSKVAPDEAKKDILAYVVVHARCSDRNAERDFYFDTHGELTTSGKNETIYVDPNEFPQPSASPRPPV